MERKTRDNEVDRNRAEEKSSCVGDLGKRCSRKRKIRDDIVGKACLLRRRGGKYTEPRAATSKVPGLGWLMLGWWRMRGYGHFLYEDRGTRGHISDMGWQGYPIKRADKTESA
jgi:hypothetical protein